MSIGSVTMQISSYRRNSGDDRGIQFLVNGQSEKGKEERLYEEKCAITETKVPELYKKKIEAMKANRETMKKVAKVVGIVAAVAVVVFAIYLTVHFSPSIIYDKVPEMARDCWGELYKTGKMNEFVNPASVFKCIGYWALCLAGTAGAAAGTYKLTSCVTKRISFAISNLANGTTGTDNPAFNLKKLLEILEADLYRSDGRREDLKAFLNANRKAEDTERRKPKLHELKELKIRMSELSDGIKEVKDSIFGLQVEYLASEAFKIYNADVAKKEKVIADNTASNAVDVRRAEQHKFSLLIFGYSSFSAAVQTKLEALIHPPPVAEKVDVPASSALVINPEEND